MRVVLGDAEVERLVSLSPRLTGRHPIREITDTADDEALILKLYASGLLFDLPLSEDGVVTSAFCDYLYARVRGWRMNKQPIKWPWREIIAQGGATEGYLQGIIVENYHYVRAAAVRQGPLLGRAANAEVFDLVREFVLSEGTHEHYFLSTLARWGVPTTRVKATIPLTGTTQFIALQHRLAHVSVLDYLAGSATLEVDPDIFSKVGDPYAPWEARYGIAPEILAPVREHIRADVDSGHSRLFRRAALAVAPVRLPLAVARSAFVSARTVFEATRVWQREMFEHYHMGGGGLHGHQF